MATGHSDTEQGSRYQRSIPRQCPGTPNGQGIGLGISAGLWFVPAVDVVATTSGPVGAQEILLGLLPRQAEWLVLVGRAKSKDRSIGLILGTPRNPLAGARLE